MKRNENNESMFENAVIEFTAFSWKGLIKLQAKKFVSMKTC